MEKYYVAFYKITENSDWQAQRLYLPMDECEKYCKEQNYAKYDIKDLDKMDAFYLHLLTDVVDFDGNYYLPNEFIPYPEYKPSELGEFQLSITLDNASDEMAFDEVYRGIEQLWTDVTVNFIFPDRNIELGIAAQTFLSDYPKFLKELVQNNQAIYHNEEFSPFKWLVWLKDGSIRIIHQNYSEEEVKTEFDIIVDKDWFLQFSQNLTSSIKEYAEAELKLYEKYVRENYGKDLEEK